MTIGAFCVIENQNKEFLLCHRRDKDLWNLPGGCVEERESPWAAAIREVKEEVGLNVVIERLIGCYFKAEKDDLVFMFLARPADNGSTTSLSTEADQIAFFSIQNMPANTGPKQAERLKWFYQKPTNIEAVFIDQ